ncbi:thioredoxin domain-containing protein [Sphingomonas sp.]|uniref:thioredoxin domain-containing protein n=1 Tax=Sphingomonas sp. TaxID=28214 RepID=UPI001ECCEC7E|nr:thioredoxin domain-containing protein [Sphingomonas sp.]MBX3593678.1 DsbA family protein [Sphingomonas sp.]
MRRIVIGLAATIALAGCGGGTGENENISVPEATSTPVAAASAPAGKQWVDTVEQTAQGGFRMGNPDAPIKLVEYGSRTCSHCAAFALTGFEPLKAYVASGKVSYEFRDFLLNPIDLGASLLGRCAGPGPFFPILDQMYQQQQQILENGPKEGDPFFEKVKSMTPPQQIAAAAERYGYLEFVKQRGVSEAQARQCLTDEAAAKALVERNQADAKKYNIPGTPTFILNDKVLENVGTWPQVEAALKGAGA